MMSKRDFLTLASILLLAVIKVLFASLGSFSLSEENIYSICGLFVLGQRKLNLFCWLRKWNLFLRKDEQRSKRNHHWWNIKFGFMSNYYLRPNCPMSHVVAEKMAELADFRLTPKSNVCNRLQYKTFAIFVRGGSDFVRFQIRSNSSRCILLNRCALRN